MQQFCIKIARETIAKIIQHNRFSLNLPTNVNHKQTFPHIHYRACTAQWEKWEILYPVIQLYMNRTLKLTTIEHQHSYWNDPLVCLLDNPLYRLHNPFQQDIQSTSWILTREIQYIRSLSIPNDNSNKKGHG